MRLIVMRWRCGRCGGGSAARLVAAGGLTLMTSDHVGGSGAKGRCLACVSRSPDDLERLISPREVRRGFSKKGAAFHGSRALAPPRRARRRGTASSADARSNGGAHMFAATARRARGDGSPTPAPRHECCRKPRRHEQRRALAAVRAPVRQTLATASPTSGQPRRDSDPMVMHRRPARGGGRERMSRRGQPKPRRRVSVRRRRCRGESAERRRLVGVQEAGGGGRERASSWRSAPREARVKEQGRARRARRALAVGHRSGGGRARGCYELRVDCR